MSISGAPENIKALADKREVGQLAVDGSAEAHTHFMGRNEARNEQSTMSSRQTSPLWWRGQLDR